MSGFRRFGRGRYAMRGDEPTAHATDTVVAVQWVARAKSPVSNDALVMDGVHIIRFRSASAPPWCRFRAKAVRPLRSRRGERRAMPPRIAPGLGRLASTLDRDPATTVPPVGPTR